MSEVWSHILMAGAYISGAIIIWADYQWMRVHEKRLDIHADQINLILRHLVLDDDRGGS